MIHPALPFLIKMQGKSQIRRAIRSLKTWRGRLYFLVGIVVFSLWLGPQIFMAFSSNASEKAAPYINAFMPFGLLFLCLMALVNELIEAGSKVISFTPGETEFLFPGPFKRRDLLKYKIITSTKNLLFIAAFISIFTMRFTHSWLVCYLGILLTLLFVHFFSMTVAFLRLLLLESAYTPSRKRVLTVLGLFLFFGVWKGVDWTFAWDQIVAGKPLVLAEAIRETWFGTIVLAPFDVFARIIVAKSFSFDLLLWCSVAVGIDLLLLITVFKLDANYLETSLAVSEKTYAKQQRMRRGGSPLVSSIKKATWSLPMLPWLNGAGPILWRQLTSAIRNAKGMLVLLVVICCALGPMMIMKGVSDSAVPTVLIITGIYSIFFTQWFPFDFRSDIDRMDWLKMIPAGSMPITIGQVFTPVIMVSFLELCLFGGLSFGVDENRVLLFIAMALVPSYNLLLFGLENLIFLLFPIRIVKAAPGDFHGFGRIMVVLFLKFLVIGGCLGSIIGMGYGGYYFLGKHIAVFVVITWTLLTCCGIAILPYIAWAFEKYDPSVDAPA